MTTKIILFIGFIGLVAFSAFGLAHTIDVTSNVKMSTLTVDSPDVVIKDFEFKFSGTDADEIDFAFNNKETGLFEASLKNKGGVEIAYGSINISDKNKFTLTLSDILTESERADLWNITYTLT